MKRYALLIVAVAVCFAIPVAAHAETISFANFGSYTTTPPDGEQATGVHVDGPFTWTDDGALANRQLNTLPTLPGWDSNAVWQITRNTMGPFVDDGTGVLTGPLATTSTITAYAADETTVLGTLTLAGDGEVSIDARPANATVIEVSGLVLRNFGNSVSGFDTPMETVSVVGKTGIYENLVQLGDWELFAMGVDVLWMTPGMTVEEVLASEDTFSLGATTPFALTGSYEMVPEPGTLILLLTGVLGLAIGLRRRS